MPKAVSDVSLSGAPSGSLDAATKAYLDAQVEPLPLGTVGYTAITADSANSSTTTTQVAVTGLSVTGTLSSTRCYRVIFKGYCRHTSGTADGRVRIWNASNATVQSFERVYCHTASAFTPFEVRLILNAPTSGSYTFKGAMDNASATGTLTIGANSANTSYITIEDIGAAV